MSTLAVRINSPKCLFCRITRWFDFPNFITDEKSPQQHVVLYTGMSYTLVFQILGIYFLKLSPKIKCRVALTNVFLSQIFLHFGQFYFYSRQVCNERLANWTAITDTLTLKEFTRNSRRGFNSWK